MSTLTKLQNSLNAIERCFLDATGVCDDIVNNDERLSPEMAETRRALDPIREHLDAAHEIAAALARKPSPDGDQELAWSKVRRSAALAKLERADVGRVNRAAPRPILPPAARGGGAFLTQKVREDELRRLRAMW
jgi:hypothetical protein